MSKQIVHVHGKLCTSRTEVGMRYANRIAILSADERGDRRGVDD